MSKISVSLNEYATSKSDGSGAVTLKFFAPPVGRVWQGTVTIPDASGLSLWTLSVGGQKFGNLGGPGPYGPLQAQSGQVIQLVGSGLLPASPYTAVLSGINDPQESPSLYTGPNALPSPAAPGVVTISGQPLFVVGVPPGPGSTQHPSNELNSAQYVNAFPASTVQILPSLAGANRYRIFSVNLSLSSQSAAGDFAVFNNFVSSVVFAGQSARFDFGPSGFPLGQGNTVTLYYQGTLTYISAHVTYTTESV
jgi:hypothetical protein